MAVKLGCLTLLAYQPLRVPCSANLDTESFGYKDAIQGCSSDWSAVALSFHPSMSTQIFLRKVLVLSKLLCHTRDTLCSRVFCHTRILHKVARLDGGVNQFISLTDRFSRKTCESNSYLLHDPSLSLTPVVSYRCSAHKHLKLYFEEDLVCANFVRFLRLNSSTARDLDIESMIQTICFN